MFGNKRRVSFYEDQLNRSRAFPCGDCDDLLGGWDGLGVIIHKRDLDLSVWEKKKLGLRFHGGEESTPARARHFFFVAVVASSLKTEGAE